MIRYFLIFLFTLIFCASISRAGDIYFVPNKGQWHSNVLFKSVHDGQDFYIDKTGITLMLVDLKQVDDIMHGREKNNFSVDCHAIKYHWKNGKPAKKIEHLYGSSFPISYFIGKDQKKWAGGLSGYQFIKQKEIYPGIDLINKSSHHQYKSEWIVAPNANPENIEIEISGAEKIEIKSGKLVIKTSLGEIIEETPYAYQKTEIGEKEIACKYVLEGNTIKFELEDYDKNLELVIDPALIFSTYSGATSNNFGFSATYDDEGFLISGSIVFNPGYPLTAGAFQTIYGGGTIDIGITKYDTLGGSLIYSTYLGGSQAECPHSLIANSFNEIFIMGTTGSADFPVTPFAYDTTFNGGDTLIPGSGLGFRYNQGADIFISKLSANGTTLLNSTFLGGTGNDGINNAPVLRKNYADEIRGEISIDSKNNIYIASSTYSIDFPIVGNVVQTQNNGQLEGVIVKMDNELNTIIWSSYFGGSGNDAVYSSALDKDDNVIITGGTTSPLLNISTNAFDATYNGAGDGYMAKFSKNGTQLLSASYFGSNAYDQIYFVETDRNDMIYIYGQTKAIDGQLSFNASFNVTFGKMFVAKLDANLNQLIFCSRFGTGVPEPNLSPSAFLVDVCNNMYIAGWGGVINGFGGTSGLPISPTTLQGTSDNSDFYNLVIDHNASSVQFATFFGSLSSAEHVDGGTSRFDRKGRVYQSVCAGCGGNSTFPTTPGAWSSTNGSTACNNAVYKIDFGMPIVVADFKQPAIGCAPYALQFQNRSKEHETTSYVWDFGDGNVSFQKNPLHTYTLGGIYNVRLIARSPTSCNLQDTITRQVIVLGNSTRYLDTLQICKNDNVQIGLEPQNISGIQFLWNDSVTLSNVFIPNPIATPNSDTSQYVLIISDNNCSDTLIQHVNYKNLRKSIASSYTLCNREDSIYLYVSNDSTGTTQWSSNRLFTDNINNSGDTLIYFLIKGDDRYLYYRYTFEECVDVDSVRVTGVGFEAFRNDKRMCKGDTIAISVNFKFDGNLSVVWDTVPGIISGYTDSVLIVSPDSTTRYTFTLAKGTECEVTGEIWVTVDSLKAQFDFDQLLCDGNVQFNNTSYAHPSAITNWTFGDGNQSQQINPSHNYLQPGFYEVILSVNDTFVCKRSIDTAQFVYIFSGSGSHREDTLFTCAFDTLTIGYLSTDSFNVMQWLPNAQIISTNKTQAEIVTANNQVFVLYLSNAQCADTVYFPLTADFLELSSSPDTVICETLPISLNAFVNGSFNELIWSTNAAFSDTLLKQNTNFNPVISNDSTFYIKAKIRGCERIDSVTILNEAIKINILGGDICFDDQPQIEVINLESNQNLTISWSPSPDIINGLNNFIINLKQNFDQKNYPFYLENQFGCDLNDTAIIQYVGPIPGNTQFTANEDTVEINTNVIFNLTTGNYVFEWFPNTIFTQNIFTQNISVSGNFIATVIVTDTITGCRLERSIPITVYELKCNDESVFVPNAFTPNGDGENDHVAVRSRIVNDIYFTIYNKWGEQVFETTKTNHGWDGNFKGRPADPGVFVYYIKGTCIDNQTITLKGNITLIR